MTVSEIPRIVEVSFEYAFGSSIAEDSNNEHAAKVVLFKYLNSHIEERMPEELDNINKQYEKPSLYFTRKQDCYPFIKDEGIKSVHKVMTFVNYNQDKRRKSNVFPTLKSSPHNSTMLLVVHPMVKDYFNITEKLSNELNECVEVKSNCLLGDKYLTCNDLREFSLQKRSF